MRQIQFTLLFIALVNATLIGQNHFLVELENRSPDVATMVRSYEGTAAIPIMANDIDGKEQYIGNYKGENLILFFWKKDSPDCTRLIPILNDLIKTEDNFNVLSFSTSMKEDLLAYREAHPIDFSVIPNSEILSEGPYGGDLGYPKIFFVDKKGIIKWVFPANELNNGIDIKNILMILHQQNLDGK